MEFSETAKFWLDSKKILALIIVLIVCARIFTAIVLPDTAYTDALYHLQITKEITKTGFLPFESNSKELAFMDMQGTVPQPFFHAALATIFVASGTGFGFELAGFFPVFITALQLALSFLLSRLFFENDKKAALIAFAFMAMQPVLAIYYSTNYTDAIAGLLVLFCFYLLVKFEKTKNHAFLFLLAFAAAAAAVSKLTAIAVVPALIVGLLYYASKSKIRNAKKIAAIAVLLILIVSAAAWFLPEFLRNQQNQELGFFQKFFGANAGQIDTLLELTPESYAKPHLSNPVALVAPLTDGFWFFLAPQLQSNIPAVNIVGIGTIQIIFAAFSLPLMLVFFYGFYKILRKREKYSFLILLIFLLGIIPFMVYLRNRVYPRMLLALIPFFGLIFAYGWREIKQQNLQKIVLALFAVMAVYSAVLAEAASSSSGMALVRVVR